MSRHLAYYRYHRGEAHVLFLAAAIAEDNDKPGLARRLRKLERKLNKRQDQLREERAKA